jgi:hypothetical protein
MVVALAATTASLAACGSSDDEPTTPAATAAAAVATPSIDPKDAAWAKEFCTALSADVKPLTPPDVQASSPGDTKDSLVAFFKSVSDQQEKQVAAMVKVGPPPNPEAAKAFAKARRELRTVRTSVDKLVVGLKAEDPKKPEDVTKLVAALGKQMKDFSGYPGPIADVAEDASIGPALKAEPSCKLAG